jgi:beta-xylosidase
VRGNAEDVDLLLTNHAFPGHDIATETITWHVQGARKPASASLLRIDEDNGNSRQAWLDMGAPDYLDASQVVALERSSALRASRVPISARDGGFDLEISLPPHAIAAVRIELARGS